MLIPVIIYYCLSLVTAVPLTEIVKTGRNENVPRIIGGQPVYAGQFPFLAAIHVHLEDASYFCGGALVNTEWVVTSGYCVDGAYLFTIQLGSISLDSSDPSLITLSADTKVIHPDYNRVNLANDIGAIKFRSPISYNDYIRPINMLPGAPLSDYSPLLTMGWGQISDSEAGIQNKAYWVSVTTIPNDQCKVFYGTQILDTMTCAEGNYNEGTCYGDTGGPLIQVVSRGQFMLVAVASFISHNGCESTDPSGYTRTFDFVDWIRNTTGFV